MLKETRIDTAPVVVDMKGISKSFKDVQALNQVDFTLRKGEIRAVIGENGAGKSTLMKILYGMYSSDQGEIRIRDQVIPSNWSPSSAIKAGIGMIHQHFSSIPVYTVLENVLLPVLKWGSFHNRWEGERVKIQRIIEEYGFEVSLDDCYGDLPIGQKQQVEIIKVLNQGIDILILDEPTSVLTPRQAESLMNLLLKLRDQGISIIIVTHKLEEAMQICNSMTVLRRGDLIATVKKADTTIQKLARLMIDRDYYSDVEPPHSLSGLQPILHVDNIDVPESGGSDIPLQGCSLTLNQGEILGVAGVSGNGQTVLAGAIVGLNQVEGGSITLGEEDVTRMSIDGRMKIGLGFIPEDRHGDGLVLPLAISENLVLGRIDSCDFCNRLFLKSDRIKAFSEEVIREFNIKTSSERTPAEQLSGGNQQKVILGRVLKSNPKAIIACQPTWGLDFGATEYVRNELKSAAAEGAGVLLISNDLDEILELSNRIVVMSKGRIVGQFPREDVDMDQLGLLMAGKVNEGDQVAC